MTWRRGAPWKRQLCENSHRHHRPHAPHPQHADASPTFSQVTALHLDFAEALVSHGLLSRTSKDGRRVEEDAVANAQILAIDEAHNFLAGGSNRTHHVRSSAADHVLMFTATPINRGAEDLLSLVDQLGADNFEDDALQVLDGLHRRGGNCRLRDDERDLLRREIQRFTVRRTKSMLNELVDAQPDAYRHPDTGRVCRYPEHESNVYSTGETQEDCAVADEIRRVAADLVGITSLGRIISVPEWLRRDYTDQRWLETRLGAANGLAAHHIRAGMRSSRAALLEHIVGTEAAIRQLAIRGLLKPQPTGNMLAKVGAARAAGPPDVDLDCPIPEWLSDLNSWHTVCDLEAGRYERLTELSLSLSDQREQAKATFVVKLIARHERVLAFDHHPITLAVLASLMGDATVPVVVATGAATKERHVVRRLFAQDSNEPAIALCSDAMNEGINLQGASAIVQFDMPSTLRVAEQRVGRVDRMDSRHDRIEVWWPGDSKSFATRADDLLAARNEESAALLGSNLPVPLRPGDTVISPEHFATEIEVADRTWDGLRDALEPVRALVAGPTALIPPATYHAHRQTRQRVLARISPVHAHTAWAYFAIRGTNSGAPHWIVLEDGDPRPTLGLDMVTSRLRDLLQTDPPTAAFDDTCELVLSRFLDLATRSEVELLPLRLQRALNQMHRTCRGWADRARRENAFDDAERWEFLARLVSSEAGLDAIDFHQAAGFWLELVQPARLRTRTRAKRSRYSRLADIDADLRANPFELDDVERAFGQLRTVDPLAQRITACILGVPK